MITLNYLCKICGAKAPLTFPPRKPDQTGEDFIRHISDVAYRNHRNRAMCNGPLELQFKADDKDKIGVKWERQQLIIAHWQKYANDIMPADVSDVQLRECKRAFYAGGTAFMHILMDGLTNGDEPQQADIQKMRDLWAELMKFKDDVVKGIE